MSYRNVCTYTKSNQQIIWQATWDENGNRIEIETPIKPYLYYQDINYKESLYKSMYGKPLRFIEFNTNFDRSEWIKSSKNIKLFEKLSPEKQYLLNKYCGMEQDVEFMKYQLKTYFFDIEVEIEGQFPDPMLAQFPLNVLSIYDSISKDMFVWTYNKDIKNEFKKDKQDQIQKQINKDYEPTSKINFYNFDNEVEMLNHFLNWWEHNYPDILTGWNIDNFDIPYIINRITKVLGQTHTKRLSPISWHKFSIKRVAQRKLRKDVVMYKIMGISVCDYLSLYRKFLTRSQQSFKLDYISKMETGHGKLDYYDMGYESMYEFMKKDFATFIKYNIIDTICVKQIDDAKHFIQLMRRVCNMGLCEYECIYKSIPYIVGALSIVAREKGMIFLTDANKEDKTESQGYEGAYVFPTTPGYYRHGIASFDFNSLYPNVMMSLNMSPETMVGKVMDDFLKEMPNEVLIKRTNGSFIKMAKDKFEKLLNQKCSISANNVLFIKPSVDFGIVPTFLDGLYKKRVIIKKESKNNLKEAKKLGDQIAKLEEQLLKLKKQN